MKEVETPIACVGIVQNPQDQIVVTSEDARVLVQQYNIQYYEISAGAKPSVDQML